MNASRSAHPLLRDREIWTVLVSMVVANALFVYAVSTALIPMGAYNYGRFMLLGLVLAAVVFLFRGWTAPFGLLAPLTVWRFHPAWLLLALLWPPLLAVVTLVGKGLLQGTGISEVSATLSVVLNPRVYPTLLIAAFVGEIVWVGYALARLSRATTTLLASLIVGLFWSAWWLPIVLIGVGVIPGMPVAAVFLNMVGVAIMCGFVYAHTRSGWVVLALQLSINSTLLIFPVSPDGGGIPTFMAFAGLYLFASLSLHAIFGPRPLLPGMAGKWDAAPPKATQ